ncbi:venom metalloproteinase antarease-like TtrivMP_A isoform X1 [Ornithodoros turicata]
MFTLYGLFLSFVLCRGSTAVEEGRIVFPRMLEARADRGQDRVLKITDDLVLNLQSANAYSENFLVRSHIDENTVQEDYFRAKDYEQYLFHDPGNKASVAVTERDGLQVEGILGEVLRIRPLPERERSDEGHVAHLLFRIDAQKTRYDDYVIPEEAITNLESSGTVVERQDIPKRIHPELFILCDSAFVQHFNKGLESIIFYFGITINAVNMRYLSVKDPNVRLRLVGFELHTRTTESFLQYHSAANIHGTASLSALREYVNLRPQNYSTYDMVYLVTGLNIIEQRGGYLQDYAGFAYVGGICTDARVGIGEDIPKTWYHVRTVAHEVGHLLGCPHDGDHAPSVLHHYSGSTRCPWSDGYIMSYIQNSRKEFRFSSCCNDMIRYLIHFRGRTCMLTNDAHITYNKEKYLPGKYLGADEQCQKFLGYILKKTYSLKDELGIAANRRCRLLCHAAESIYGYETHLGMFAVDGTRCADKKVCYNGYCKKIPKIKPETLAE